MTTRNTLVAAAATDSDGPESSPSRREWVLERRWEIVRFLSPLAVLLTWQAGSAWGLIDPDILPAPSTIARAGFELIANGQLAEALRVSGVRAAEGLLLGGVVGVVLGAAVGLSRLADAVVDPTMQMIRALPHLGLIPLFIVWFGIGELPKVLMVALGAAFPLYLNTTSAIRQVDPKLFETAQVLGFSFWQRLRVIVIPGATPQVLVGLRQSLALSWLTLIVAEQINADAGVGFLINNARDFLRIDVIIFGLVVYALLGIVTDAIVRVLERRALRYRS
ncbi:aliphatic sulfonates transport permease protein ssuC [Mycobacteroides abscessus subsp. bolletii]|uniref:ABC transporter permease n=1 Tax=Mycobacteroides abscessus TaxID=36809 RepID=UPI000927292E|nr:ABC transporter permease [Mycobacteroides abscessus]SIA42448.1 aliphatic sulfonates transport permease protein ssuC [Mycobacteroides abscessus subsp. bolletii]SIA87201.1 aliphatic sulfonates transport permease protein ssuC [Mycobacteroides abscessus subsp. bolletii]